jgi:hypothetical protein
VCSLRRSAWRGSPLRQRLCAWAPTLRTRYCAHVFACVHASVCVRVCACVGACVCLFVCARTSVFLCLCVRLSVSVCAADPTTSLFPMGGTGTPVCVCVCVCVCISVLFSPSPVCVCIRASACLSLCLSHTVCSGGEWQHREAGQAAAACALCGMCVGEKRPLGAVWMRRLRHAWGGHSERERGVLRRQGGGCPVPWRPSSTMRKKYARRS